MCCYLKNFKILLGNVYCSTIKNLMISLYSFYKCLGHYCLALFHKTDDYF